MGDAVEALQRQQPPCYRCGAVIPFRVRFRWFCSKRCSNRAYKEAGRLRSRRVPRFCRYCRGPLTDAGRAERFCSRDCRQAQQRDINAIVVTLRGLERDRLAAVRAALDTATAVG
jgi:hypothetical protein